MALMSRHNPPGLINETSGIARHYSGGLHQDFVTSGGPPLPNPVRLSELVIPFSTSPGAVPSGGTSGDVAVNVVDGILFIVR